MFDRNFSHLSVTLKSSRTCEHDTNFFWWKPFSSPDWRVCLNLIYPHLDLNIQSIQSSFTKWQNRKLLEAFSTWFLAMTWCWIGGTFHLAFNFLQMGEQCTAMAQYFNIRVGFNHQPKANFWYISVTLPASLADNKLLVGKISYFLPQWY